MTPRPTAVQRWIRARLAASAALVALVGARVFDEVPKDTAFPYVEIGQIDDRFEDLDVVESATLTIVMWAWSRPSTTGSDLRGRLEATAMGDAIAAALQAKTVDLGDHALLSSSIVSSTVERSDDGKTWFANLLLTILVDTPKGA